MSRHRQLPHVASTHAIPESLRGMTADDFRAIGSSVYRRDEPSEADRIIEDAADWERRQREWTRETYRRAS